MLQHAAHDEHVPARSKGRRGIEAQKKKAGWRGRRLGERHEKPERRMRRGAAAVLSSSTPGRVPCESLQLRGPQRGPGAGGMHAQV